MTSNALEYLQSKIDAANLIRSYGRVTRVVGLTIEGVCPEISIGATCFIEVEGANPVHAEVVGFRENRVILMPYGDIRGIAMGNRIQIAESISTVSVGNDLLGRVIDGMGTPIDQGPEIIPDAQRQIYNAPVNPLERKRISEPMDLGIRSINALLTCGKGQRIGIMAGSGVGKSTLLGMIARYTNADVNVIALIGERGRELREFIERDLGPEGLARSVVIVATSDNTPVIRARAAQLATTIAEHFRDQGKSVLFMMDSLTRWAMAQREIGLAIGEPPTSRGYTPSVFAQMPKLLERAGTCSGPGSITGIYTILVEGDDLNEPITDHARSILDGHIVLSRTIAARAHFPSIDIGNSISRVMDDITHPDQQALANKLRRLISTFEEAQDLIQLGVYAPGRDLLLDEALQRIERIQEFLYQDRNESSDFSNTLEHLAQVLA